ncbi:MAG: hypothetical protein JW795_11760, partial [Chitinivibrionales bacterium]|nr:hypothetical protein [Chitinivibrionales bacterium]
SITNLYYLLNLNITDGYYFTVFMIIIAGVFLGIRAAFIWAVIQASLLITIAYFSPEYTVFQDLPIYFGKQPVSGNQKLYFSTFIMLFIVSAFISILFERYVTDLINTVKKTHDEKVILESELFQAQKLESIGLLAGGIAHDFNKGLQSIGSCANLILDNFRDHHQDLTRYARNIHDSCAMISESTRKLLDFTRRGREERANINMHEAIETMVNLLSFMLNKKITIRTELSAQQCTINGIYSQLQCMLMNLAVNASDAMAGGGVLTFSTHDSRAKYLEIRVSDTGAGMDDFIKAKLFTPFFTTKPQGKGTGLGLSIVKRIVEAHQGAIEVTGEKEKGATFSIFLPLAKKPSF